MPPRTPQKKLPTKSPQNSSKSDSDLTPIPQSDSSLPQISNPSRETFDLNEPYCDEFEGGLVGVSEIKQVVEKKAEIPVKEVREVRDENNNRNNNHSEEIPVNREKKKQKEFEVFVGGLDRDADEDDLEKVFKKIGDVVEVRLVKNKYSQKNKGFAFVRFASIEQAKKAAAELNYTQIRGKVCEVTRNNDNETLHLGNICTTWTKDTLVERLRPFELENLDDVHLIEDPRDRRKNRGYAFLNFSTHMDAVAACNKLQKGSLYLGTTTRADIAFAKSAVEPDEEIMSQVKSIFLDGLPPSWDEAQVQHHFQKFGEIENVQLARNMPSAKRRDFGFISFKTRDAALNCIDTVNNEGIGEGSQKVPIRATLRKPLQRRITAGGWRGYNNDYNDSWSARSSGPARSYSSRESRFVEPFDRSRGRGRGRSSRIGGGYSSSRYTSRGDAFESESSPPVDKYGHSYTRYSSRDVFEAELSPVEEYDSRFRRGSLRQVATTPSHRPRGGGYIESSSSNSRRSTRLYEDYPPSYSRVSSREQYEDDGFDVRYEYFEDDAYDYPPAPPPSRLKRPYSAVDEEQLVSRPLTRRSRSGELDIDMDVYPVRGVSSYEGYSRSVPDQQYGTSYDNAGYETRYSSGRGAASRSYDY
ncbi:hypothetical protein ACHQM5_000079 [Ranunculus cassubicifolius]